MKSKMNISQLSKSEDPGQTQTKDEHWRARSNTIDEEDEEQVVADNKVDNNLKSVPIITESKVCYDNPAFNGLSVSDINININDNNNDGKQNNHNFNQNNIPTNNLSDISKSSSTEKISNPDTPSLHSYQKHRTRTLSVSSVRSLKNALHDRRYSRRQSIVQRTHDQSGGPELPNVSPLRRKMSFIKDLSGADDEPLTRAATQILLASLCAGFGNVGAGVIIDIIQKWRVFIDVKTMFVLVPSLLGLKGNLEMTMASRLSTEANLGHMDSWPRTLNMIGGDMALVQCQATVISFLAAFVAIGIDLCQNQVFDLDKCLVLTASSVLTANVACFLLGLVMAFVIVFSNKVNIDPDNIATPIAASLGDVSTAGLFALFAQWIYEDHISGPTSVPLIAIINIVAFLLLLPVFYAIARKNSFTHELVHSGWAPVISAMIISSGGGVFLDSAVERYDKLPPFQPVICGVGGNLVAVAASKISTKLHKNHKLGTLPFGISRFSSPVGVFWNRQDQSTRLCLILFSMAIPLHLLYSLVIWGIQSDKIKITFYLISLYISFATAQVLILLFVGYNLVHILWSFTINPDMSAIPLLTALGDLLGSAFLLIAFLLLEQLNDPNAVSIVDSLSTEAYIGMPFTNSTF